MNPSDIKAWLAASFDDKRLSRGERQELTEILNGLGSDVDREVVRREAFAFAGRRISTEDPQVVLDWLEEIVKVLRSPIAKKPDVVEAYFSPGDDCYQAICRMLRNARKTVDICVFTITDDRVADSILETHQRGIAIRIITDNAKAEDLGSDIDRLQSAGIPIRIDQSPFHMHHKFAIFDNESLLNGSYNWTRGAAHDNEENLTIARDMRLVSAFSTTFEKLWTKLA